MMRHPLLFLTLAMATLSAGLALTGGPVPCGAQDRIQTLFEPSTRCEACHNQLTDAAGNDLSIGVAWRSTMMAHAAKDPYWQASVRRETRDHPAAAAAIEDKCATCHMPITRYTAAANRASGKVFDHLPVGAAQSPDSALAWDGVSCTVCHQITAENLGQKASFSGGFKVDEARPMGARPAFGRFDIPEGTQEVMRSASGFAPEKQTHIQRSAFCATCHTLYTHALDEDGRAVAELPEQVPYLEWLHSAYRESESCQDCHMIAVPEPTPIASVLGRPRAPFVRHTFRGGNATMLRLLNRNAGALGVTASPSELAASLRETTANLTENAGEVVIHAKAATFNGTFLTIPVAVENLTGHKLPTAYPSRRVWLRVRITDRKGNALLDSGALQANGAISGNDNDADPDRFEPHYQTVSRDDQVQIYESILGTTTGAVTTGLMKAAVYLKDNRLLPAGFDKSTAEDDVAVYGEAFIDESFQGGGDITLYRVDIGQAEGPFTITAALWYQSIAHRWAENLAAVDAAETHQFTQMYRALPARATATRLAVAGAIIAAPGERLPGPENDTSISAAPANTDTLDLGAP